MDTCIHSVSCHNDYAISQNTQVHCIESAICQNAQVSNIMFAMRLNVQVSYIASAMSQITKIAHEASVTSHNPQMKSHEDRLVRKKHDQGTCNNKHMITDFCPKDRSLLQQTKHRQSTNHTKI